MINPIKADSIISGILESPNENKSIEFKPSIPWPKKINELKDHHKVQEIIESILAMSNLRNGGKIILGIEKGPDDEGKNYVLSGMDTNHLATYDQDLIFDHVRNFGEPEPRFQILNVEFQEKHFMVFAVQSFEFAPIICKNNRNLEKLESAVFYIRNDKPETKKITETWEMREIIDLAIEKELDLFSTRMQRFFKTMSSAKILKSTPDDQAKFKDELKDIT